LQNVNQKKIINQYSVRIDQICLSLEKESLLFSNQVLSKHSIKSRDFINLIGGDSLKKKGNLSQLLYAFKYYCVSLSYIFLWLIKKIFFNLLIPKPCINSSNNLHLIDIYILTKSTLSDKKFRDRYLSELVDVIKKNNLNYAYLISFYEYGFNPINWFKLNKILRKSTQKFITEFDLLNLTDFFKIIIFTIKYPIQLNKLIKSYKINDDIDRAIISSLNQSKQDFTIHSYLRYLVGRRIAQKFGNSKLLSYFENSAPNKCLYKGIKDNSNKIKIYAYQQYALHLWHYGMTPISPYESIFSITPDKIIVNGIFYIPEDSNLNYSSLAIRNKEVFNVKIKDNSSQCLVLLPQASDLCITTLELVSHFKIKRNRLKIKPHPLLASSILNSIPKDQLIYGNFYDCIADSNIIITSETGAALEAISIGLSIIVIGIESDLSLNPLIDLGRGVIWEFASDVEGLNNSYNKLLKHRENNFNEVNSLANKYKKLFFTNSTEKLLLQSFDFYEND